MRTSCLAFLPLLLSPSFAVAEEDLDYSLVDRNLKLVRIDSAGKESFLAVRVDTMGRIFVGGREELFVYEPDDKGGYKPRQSLYKFPNQAWIYDIAIRGNDLYVMTVSALYLFPDAVVKRERLQPKRLIWGVPTANVHQCFHCLAWGPEGDLYFTMGDPVAGYGDFNRPDHWIHFTLFSQPEGTRTPYTGVGGVFRCKPDGSGLQVVARGTRNSVGLAFDKNWNLFTNDNDHESIPADYVPGRLLHVTPHAYFSWPRGWLVSKTPERADLLETMTDGLGRFVPVGQAYYGDSYLKQFHNNLLVARWCTRSVTRYPLEARDSSFKTVERQLLVGEKDARPVGVAVGRGGRIFVTIAHMAHNDMSPIYRSDLVMIARQEDDPRHVFKPYDATTAPPEKLFAELAHEDCSRREAAHVEVLRRGKELLTWRNLFDHEVHSPDSEAHWPWLWTRVEELNAKELLTKLESLQTLQAFRAGIESSKLSSAQKREVLLKRLRDPSQFGLAAVHGFFNLDGELPAEIVAVACRRDTYIRQAAAMLLAEKAPLARIAELIEDENPRRRMVGVLAAGFRLTVPPATKPIPDDWPLAKLPPKDAYVIQYADATVDLRQFGRIGNFTMADCWKAGKHSDEQEKLFGLLRQWLTDTDEPVRLQAAHFLHLLNDERTEPDIAKLRKESVERRLATAPITGIAKAWCAGPFPDGLKGLDAPHAPEDQMAVDLSASYQFGETKLTWKEASRDRLFEFGKLFEKRPLSSYYAYCRLESVNREPVMLLVGSSDGVKVWHNGKEVWMNRAQRGALPFQDSILLDLQPGSNDLLLRVHSDSGDGGLYLHYRALGKVIARMPEKLNIETLAERLKSATGAQNEVPKAFLEVDWAKAVARGDAVKGRQLFGALSCVKCHAIGANTTTGGPSLAEARNRFTVPYLVESILLPSKQVSPVFLASSVETTSGVKLTGLIVAETNDKIELLLPDATRKTIMKSDIAERNLLKTSPMPAGIVKTPEELRDLLAYLLSEKPTPP
jgi:putative heme-binding domain-containing protein